MGTYVVATVRPWNIERFHDTIRQLPGTWHLISEPAELTLPALQALAPDLVFFPHWNHLVGDSVLDAFECIGFHETDLPYGRGGSPIQNLIAAGHRSTVISAMRMVTEMDAGDIYLKRDLSLDGAAQEIFTRASHAVAGMIEEIITSKPTPEPQEGAVSTFKRRTPAQSELTADIDSLDSVFDHIRMLDAEGYPRAFLTVGGLRVEFRRASRQPGVVVADVRITQVDGDHS